MWFCKSLQSQKWGKTPWIPDFQTILEKHYLNASVGGQVLMAHGIDDGFKNGLAGNFPNGLRLRRVFAFSNVHIKMLHNKLRALRHLLEQRSADLLQSGHRAFNHCAVELGAFDFYGRKVFLRAWIEKQCRRIGHAIVIPKQIQMLENILDRRLWRQGKAAFRICDLNELADEFSIQVLPFQLCVTAGVERSAAENFLFGQKTD